MAIYDDLKKIILPRNVIKKVVTSAFGVRGIQTVAGPGNEGVDLEIWIQERIDDGTIDTGVSAIGYTNIEDEGIPLTNRDTINFTGVGVTVTDTSGKTTVNIPGGTNYTDEQAQDAVGAMTVDGTLVYDDVTPLLTRGALTGDVTASQGSNITTIAIDTVTNSKLANMPANTVKVRNNAAAGDPVDMDVPLNTLVGRNAGNIAPISLGTNLSMSGDTLNATFGSGITTLTIGSARISYMNLSGIPILGFTKSSGVATMTVSGGTIKLIELTDNLQATDTASNSIRYDFIGTGTNIINAYPTATKYIVNAVTPSVTTIGDVGDQQDNDNTPPVLYGNFNVSGSGSMSARLNNITTQYYIKFTWTQR